MILYVSNSHYYHEDRVWRKNNLQPVPQEDWNFKSALFLMSHFFLLIFMSFISSQAVNVYFVVWIFKMVNRSFIQFCSKLLYNILEGTISLFLECSSCGDCDTIKVHDLIWLHMHRLVCIFIAMLFCSVSGEHCYV